MSFKLVVIILLIFLTSCYYTRNKGQYRDFEKIDFQNKGKLKLDGYFYTEYEGGKGNSINIYDTDKIRPIIFYVDGKVRVYSRFSDKIKDDANNLKLNSYEKINKYFQAYLKDTYNRENNSFATYNGWGKWRITGDTLKIMYYVAGSAAVPFPIFEYWLLEFDGKILNDTTFVMNKYINRTTGKAKDINKIYKFEEFNIKPDSSIID